MKKEILFKNERFEVTLEVTEKGYRYGLFDFYGNLYNDPNSKKEIVQRCIKWCKTNHLKSYDQTTKLKVDLIDARDLRRLIVHLNDRKMVKAVVNSRK